MNGLLKASLLAFVGCGMASTARAGAIFLNLMPGYSVINSLLPTGTHDYLGAKLTMGIEVVKPFESVPIAVGVYYEGFFESNYGNLPLNNNGVDVYYYPFGIPNLSKNIDGNVTVLISRPAIFVKTNVGLTFFNYRNTGSQAVFGASAINYQIGGGFDYPISRILSIGLEGDYMTTFGAVDASVPANPVSATGFLFLTRFGFIIE